jgi:hypothetical protein
MQQERNKEDDAEEEELDRLANERMKFEQDQIR